MKDRFSHQSSAYQKFRPTYPEELFTFINGLVNEKTNCWDCGTGNGQVAKELSQSFENVYATDISANQISEAPAISNIHYSVQPAEQTDFTSDLFDLVMVAQAVHWFEFDRFYDEVKRTGKKNAVVVLVGYGLMNITHPVDEHINHFYSSIVGPYWDPERKYIDEAYRTIPFPFQEIDAPAFKMTTSWTLEHLVGYLNTWSAVKNYIQEKDENPVDQLMPVLKEAWGDQDQRQVEFPLSMRVGRIHS